jgi:hypothetical protein
VRVNHRRGHILVPQQCLHGSNVVAHFQEVRGEAVPEGVARDVLREAGLADRRGDGAFQGPFVNMMPATPPTAWIARPLPRREQELPAAPMVSG